MKPLLYIDKMVSIITSLSQSLDLSHWQDMLTLIYPRGVKFSES